MSGFRFRLDRVLRVRRATEEIQRVRLAEAEGVARDREAEARAGTRAVLDARGSLQAEQSAEVLDAARVLVSIDATARLESIEVDAQKRAGTARSAAELERATWRDARAGVLGLERLEDRERTRFRSEQDVREERAIEEVAARRAELARLGAARTRKNS